jgi:hypothetical protein
MNTRTVMPIALWSVLVAWMFWALFLYGAREGERGAPPARWVEMTSVTLEDDRWNLVLFVHPRCPCSRASFAEFERLHAVHRDRIASSVVLFCPVDADGSWVKGVVADRAGAMPGVRVVTDPDGVTTRAFGVRTSGHLLAYDERGDLRYSGGLTSSRGHEGLSDGTRFLSSLLADDSLDGCGTFAVFGCPILDPESLCFDEGCVP